MVILVTGASSGIGSSISTYLSAKGHIVYGTSRRSQKEQKNFQWLKLDVNHADSIHQGIEKILKEQGRLDILINNAGLGMISALEESPMNNVNQVMQTNFYGVLHLCQAVIPIMRTQKKGKIINISSIAGLMGLPYRAIYSASKFAVEGLTEALRIELTKFNIQVCTLQPGSIQTDISGNRASFIDPGSIYFNELENIEKIINREVENGLKAMDVAIKVEKIVRRKKIKPKYIVARPFQKMVSCFKYFLPSPIYESLVRKHYEIK